VDPLSLETRALNVASEWRKDTSASQFVRKFPGMQILRTASPGPIRKIFKALLTKKTLRKTDLHPVWDPETKNEVIEQIKSDSNALLQHYGKNADFWKSLAQSGS